MSGKILKFIPSRIGEPLTALAVHQDIIIFGSISGYVGYYFPKDHGKVIYDEVVLFNVSSS